MKDGGKVPEKEERQREEKDHIPGLWTDQILFCVTRSQIIASYGLSPEKRALRSERSYSLVTSHLLLGKVVSFMWDAWVGPPPLRSFEDTA